MAPSDRHSCSAGPVFGQISLDLTEFRFCLSFSPSKPAIDVPGRGDAVFSSVQDVLAGLCQSGYITDQITATVVFLSSRLHKPILLEGPPGSGKTELAYAVAKATNSEVERLQCFEGINEEKAIGRFDESLQRLAVELYAKSGPVEWETLKQELHGQRFFSAGPLLRALQHPRACVLLIWC
jgi:MoxR-like ATPase